MLKKGVTIYLNHLIPYFSRISGYPSKDYPLLKEYMLNDIRENVKKNQNKIEELYEKVKNVSFARSPLATIIDLEELRNAMESEISSDLFKITFDNDVVLSYVNEIKTIEKKLYSHYNTVVILYIQSL
jgi:hypothetical protein